LSLFKRFPSSSNRISVTTDWFSGRRGSIPSRIHWSRRPFFFFPALSRPKPVGGERRTEKETTP